MNERARMTFYTIGYGGRGPTELVERLRENAVQRVVDVRLRPDRASMGAYVWSKDETKGIRGLLERHGVAYQWLPELGNLFLDLPDWKERYTRLIETSGDLLLSRLLELNEPFCLLCAEKDPSGCHREVIAQALIRRGLTLARHIV